MSFLKKILKSGITHTHDPLDSRRLIFFNYLILFCISATLLLMVITAFFGLAAQAIICFVGALLLSTPLYLNFKGHFISSKFIFLIVTTSLIAGGTLINVNKELYVESENILIALMAISMFLVDAVRKHIVFWSMFIVFLGLKVYALSSEDISEGYYFTLTIINNCILGVVLYAFLYAFRSILVKALDRSEVDERKLFSMIDNVPVFLALVDKKGKLLMANEEYASNFGFDKRDLIGKTREEVLPPRVLANQNPYFERAQKGESVTFLQETVLPNGTTIAANGKYEPVLDSNGEVEFITICVDNVTPLIKAQEALKVANETKDKLFSIIAHDIKSPLSMFHTFLNVSEQANMGPKEFFNYQEMLKDRLKSLTGTVDDLLDWSRMQLGGISAYPSMVNVNQVVSENVDLFDTLIKKKNIEFKVATPQNVSAWIDENHFRVALRNLIHNAIKFTNGGGVIKVDSTQTATETVVRVSDTGIGMDTATINSIIKKEIQDSQAGTDRESGTGLGLSLSLGLLEKNNCEVSVKSELNKGTEFEIRIPNNQ